MIHFKTLESFYQSAADGLRWSEIENFPITLDVLIFFLECNWTKLALIKENTAMDL